MKERALQKITFYVLFIVAIAAIMVSFTSCIEQGIYMDEDGIVHKVRDVHELDQIKNDLILESYTTPGVSYKTIVGIYNGNIPEYKIGYRNDSIPYSYSYKRVKRIKN